MKDLKEAYQEIRESILCDKTIYRSIRRLNLLFNPLAYGETPKKGAFEDKNGTDSDDENDMEEFRIIQISNQKGKNRYIFNSELPTRSIDANNALFMALGLYTQQCGLLKGHFETSIKEILRDMLARISAYNLCIQRNRAIHPRFRLCLGQSRQEHYKN